MSGQQINVGDVVIVHDDCPLYGVTNHASSKQIIHSSYLKKVSVLLLKIEGVEEIVDNLDCPLTTKCSHHNADQHAGQQLAEWTKIICVHPVDVRDW